MEAVTSSPARSSKGAPLTILLATAVAGTLDITDACVYWGVTHGVAPQRIFQSVASGLLGKDAYEGGARTAVLGLGLHFSIMAVMVTVYVLASLRLSILTKRPVLMGLGYGLATYLVMNYIVLPLSAAGPRGHFVLPNFVNALMAHLVLVGLVVAMIMAWRERRASTL